MDREAAQEAHEGLSMAHEASQIQEHRIYSLKRELSEMNAQNLELHKNVDSLKRELSEINAQNLELNNDRNHDAQKKFITVQKKALVSKWKNSTLTVTLILTL